MKKFYIFSLLTAIVFSAKSQCMLRPVSLQQRANSSDAIIEGKVISSKSFWNDQHNYIFTSNLISVTQVLKGQVSQGMIEMITEGGQMDDRLQIVEPSLQVQAEQEGIFMLEGSVIPSQYGYTAFKPYSGPQGFIRFSLQENKAYEPFRIYSSINGELKTELQNLIGHSISDLHALQQTGGGKFGSQANITAASITGISPTTITAGTSSVLTITGSGFGATQGASIVEFKNADDGGSTFIPAHSSQITSWSNTMITVMVPTKASTVCGTAGTGQVRVTVGGTPSNLSPQTLTVAYGQLNVYYNTSNTVLNTRHVGLGGTTGITWQMFTGFDASLGKAPFIRAFNSWRCATNINWKLGLTTTTNVIAGDGVNIIRFDIGAELPAGVLGVCTSYYQGCGPTVNFYVSELDICFDSGTTWQYGPANAGAGQIDFESVALHELGHGHQSSHVIDNLDVMHWSIGPAVNKRVLNASDINNGLNVMARNLSGGVCGFPTMTPISAASCSLSAPTASFTLPNPVCQGANVALNSTVTTGDPTNWTWTVTGGAPASFTVQNPTSTYATPGTYTITLQAANGMGNSTISKTISIIPSPTVTASSATICAGNSATLTAGGANAYTWSPGGLTGSIQALSPVSSVVYTVTGTNGTCTAKAFGNLVVNPSPTLSIAANNTMICEGITIVLSAGGATNYTINPGGFTTASTVTPLSSTVYTVTGNSSGCNGIPATITISVSTCTGVKQLNSGSEIVVYPNPTKNITSVSFGEKYFGKLSVYNSLGQSVTEQSVNGSENASIDLSTYARGVYFIRITNDEKHSLIKLIKE